MTDEERRQSKLAATRRWIARNPEKRAAQLNRYKLNNAEKIKASQKATRAKNKEHRAKVHRAWVARNKERRFAYMKKWYAENKTEMFNRFKQWSAENFASRKAYKLEWCRNHPEAIKSYNSRRSARKRGADVGCKRVNALIQKWRGERSFVCYWCNVRFGIRSLTVDHIIPISKNGKHSAENICPSCRHCNSSKNDKLQTDPHYRGQMLLC